MSGVSEWKTNENRAYCSAFTFSLSVTEDSGLLVRRSESARTFSQIVKKVMSLLCGDIRWGGNSFLLNFLLCDLLDFRLFRCVGIYRSMCLLLVTRSSGFGSRFVLFSFFHRSGFRCFPRSGSWVVFLGRGGNVVHGVLDGFRRGSESVDEGNSDSSRDENPWEIRFGGHD